MAYQEVTALQLEEEIHSSSPWTKHKLSYLDKDSWEDRSIRWKTQFVEDLEGYAGLRIAVRNLQPFAKVLREGCTFYVDVFSIDAGNRGFKPLTAYSPETHEARHGDLSTWEKAKQVGLLDDIERGCSYNLVLHRAVTVDSLNFVEFGRVSNDVPVGCPTEDLKRGVSGVLDEEADSVEYVQGGVTLKFTIHRSLSDCDKWGADMKMLYGSMREVNQKLNNGEVPGEEDVDWLMAAKVMQRSRRDGRFRWAATIGRTFAGFGRLAVIDKRKINPLCMKTVARRVLLDLFYRDAHRIIMVVGGVAGTVVGATQTSIEAGTIIAGITLIATGFSTGTKRIQAGKRSATRELIMNSGSSFNRKGGGYGKVVTEHGEVAAQLEVGVLECMGYRFKRDVAGNVMCVTRWGDVRACIIDRGKIVLDARGMTSKALLGKDVELPQSYLVG